VFPGLSPGGKVGTFALEVEAAIEGTARTATGEPVSEAVVEVSLGGRGHRGATTDGQGRYRVEGLPPGEAEVVLVPGKGMRQRQWAMLTAGKVEIVDFIQALGSISGRATRRGEPAPEAQVLIRHAIDPAIRETTTATDDGRFRIAGLPEGTYLVGAKSFDRSGAIEARRIVEVGETEAKVDIEISGAGICGEVVDRRTGQPLPGATVLLFSRSTGYVPADRLRFPFDWKLRDSRRLPPAEAGFAFAEIEEGIYYLVAALPDGNEAIGWLGPFELPKGGTMEGLALQAGGAESLEVEAVDARSRSPVERFHVALRLESGIPFLERDGAGKAALRDLPSGNYVLEVDSAEHLAAVESLQLDGEVVARTIPLERAAWIVVELEGRVGTAGAAIAATAIAGGDPGWSARTAEGNHPVLVDAHGPGDAQPFRLKIRPGRYTMRFEVATRSADLGIRPLVMREIEVSVPPAGESVVKLQIQPMK